MSGSAPAPTRTRTAHRTTHRPGDPLDLSGVGRLELRLLEQLAAGWEAHAIAQRNGWSKRRTRAVLDSLLRSIGLSGDTEHARRAICSALRASSDDA